MSLKLILGSVVSLALILLPEPITTATGTLLGFAILSGVFAVGGFGA